MTKYEGSRQAKGEAELNFRKTKEEQFVVKSLDGGLHYFVTKDVSNLKPQEKVLFHFKEDKKLK